MCRSNKPIGGQDTEASSRDASYHVALYHVWCQPQSCRAALGVAVRPRVRRLTSLSLDFLNHQMGNIMVCPSHRVVGRVNELLSVECYLHGLPVMKAQCLVVSSVCIIRVNENSLFQRAEEFDFFRAWLPDAPGRGRGALVRNPDRDTNSCSPGYFPLSCNGADKTRTRTLAEVWPWHKQGA